MDTIIGITLFVSFFSLLIALCSCMVADRIAIPLVFGAIGFMSMISSIGLMFYNHHKTMNSEVQVINLGVGRVIRLEEESRGKYSYSTYTVIRLKNRDYRCYGYFPEAVKLSVVETKNLYSGKSSYKCELLE